MSKDIVDVQGQSDGRNQPITKVGIKHVAFRSLIKFDVELIPFQGDIKCFVYLDASKKGTHMSRMARGLFTIIGNELTYKTLENVSNELIEKLETERLYLELNGDVIRKKKSPINDLFGFEKFEIGFNIVKTSNKFDARIILKVIGTSLCPASKINSKEGAHNQRSLVTAELPFTEDFNLSAVVDLIESNFSTRVYPVLKLDDESFVTEDAYSNPKFVEDIVRDVATSFNKNSQKYYRVECENYESIHTHNAYALILND